MNDYEMEQKILSWVMIYRESEIPNPDQYKVNLITTGEEILTILWKDPANSVVLKTCLVLLMGKKGTDRFEFQLWNGKFSNFAEAFKYKCLDELSIKYHKDKIMFEETREVIK